MRHFLKVLAALALAVCSSTALDGMEETKSDSSNKIPDKVGPRIRDGKKLADPENKSLTAVLSTEPEDIVPGMEVTSVEIVGKERVDGIGFMSRFPDRKERSTFYGTSEGDTYRMTLKKEEYITKVRWAIQQHEGNTRVTYLEMTTSKGNVVSGGKKTTASSQLYEDVSPRFYQVGGFKNLGGPGVDNLQLAHTCITPDCTPFDETRLG